MAASRFCNGFAATMLLAVGFAVAAVIAGLIIAFYVGIAAGGAIVLSALTILGVAMIWKR